MMPHHVQPQICNERLSSGDKMLACVRYIVNMQQNPPSFQSHNPLSRSSREDFVHMSLSQVSKAAALSRILGSVDEPRKAGMLWKLIPDPNTSTPSLRSGSNACPRRRWASGLSAPISEICTMGMVPAGKINLAGTNTPWSHPRVASPCASVKPAVFHHRPQEQEEQVMMRQVLYRFPLRQDSLQTTVG